ncbi:MAG: glycosyltransferase family 39 protein, partial [Solirubrobacteraceae bacterium]|nr:glycosyltransferase family 39 protein [Solirubrobacteraceae bacterium]
MSSVAARPEPVQRLRAGSLSTVLTILGLIALCVISLQLRTQALRAGFWIDEGLSVGIATRDIWDIPGVLRMDGSPPLYYLLLHVWMSLFGSGEGATHGLSVACTIAMVPVAWWAARGLAGTRAAWMAAVLAAFHPFLTFYAQETRMYALAALLALLFAACWARAYALDDRRYLVPTVLSGALLLYTHNWAIFLLCGSVAGVAALWWRAPQRRAFTRDVLLGYGGIGLLYLAWVPTLLYQAANTGAPWARRPGTEQLLEGAFVALGSG